MKKTNVKLSVVVTCYNMARELPRTLETLLPFYQRNIAKDDYEIIVVDNGSSPAFEIPQRLNNVVNIRLITVVDPKKSPVNAINEAVLSSYGEYVAVLIDGARMLSPGYLYQALNRLEESSNAVVTAMAYHLGPGPQSVTMTQGYDQIVEDSLLDSINWRDDGYELFTISEMASSSGAGLFEPLSESNSIALSKSLWNQIGGFDDRFVSAGGGLANLDLYKRLCEHKSSKVYMLIGEGSFHQFHGGVSTNTPGGRFAEFEKEYTDIRGRQFSKPTETAELIGVPSTQALKFISQSVVKSTAIRASKISQQEEALSHSIGDKYQSFNSTVLLGLFPRSQNEMINWFSPYIGTSIAINLHDFLLESFTTDEMSGYFNSCLPDVQYEDIKKEDELKILINRLQTLDCTESQAIFSPFLNRNFSSLSRYFDDLLVQPSYFLVISSPDDFADHVASSYGLPKKQAKLLWFQSYKNIEVASRSVARKCIHAGDLLAADLEELVEKNFNINNTVNAAENIEEGIYAEFYTLLLNLLRDDLSSRNELDTFYEKYHCFDLVLDSSMGILTDVLTHKNEVIVSQHLRLEEMLVVIDRLKNSRARYKDNIRRCVVVPVLTLGRLCLRKIKKAIRH